LINGANGFTGRVAVQIAKYYGAKKIIATGRNEQSLQSLSALGADELISLKMGDEDFMSKIKAQHKLTPIDIIIDYLWGHSASLILASLKGRGSFTHRTRFISIGAVTGDIIKLSAENLRSVDLQISGSGLGSWKKDEVRKLFGEILPEMFQLATEDKLKIETVDVSLKDIETVWEMDVPNGKRLVVII
jgi:NADPH:quinone reductase-like Zn-dependent oxidoreductase